MAREGRDAPMGARRLQVLLLALGCGGAPATEPIDTEPVRTAGTTPSGTVPAGAAALSEVAAWVEPAYPTVVHVGWTQSAAADVHLEFRADDGEWRASPVRSLTEGGHEELILGVPYDAEVTWRLLTENDAGPSGSPDRTIATGPRPASLPVASLLLAQPTGWDSDMDYVLVAVSENERLDARVWTLLIDRQGRTVWAHRSPLLTNTLHPRLSATEDSFLVDHSTFFATFNAAGGQIVELKIDGSVQRTWLTPGHHHPFTQQPDGSLVYMAYTGASPFAPDDDLLVWVDPDDDVRSILFSCDEFVRGLGALPSNSDFSYCGSNTVSYSASEDAFLVSLFTHDTVVQIDAATGAATRWFGDVPDSWGFEPANTQFWYQHGAVFTPEGTLLVSTHSTPDFDSDLAVREYRLDASTERLVEVFSAGIGLGIAGHQLGEAHRLASGNTLHNFGTNAVLREYDPDGAVVWDVRWEETQTGGQDRWLGRSAPVTGSLYDFAPPQP